jgi:hypothetical protein
MRIVSYRLDGSGRVYPPNFNNNDSVPQSSVTPPPPMSPTATKTLVRQVSSNLAIDEQNFPRLPSPPQGVYD